MNRLALEIDMVKQTFVTHVCNKIERWYIVLNHFHFNMCKDQECPHYNQANWEEGKFKIKSIYVGFLSAFN